MMRSFFCLIFILGALHIDANCPAQELTPEETEIVLKAQQDRIKAIEKAMPSVIAVYGDDRQGGGSGVIIHPSGIGLTNHHVIMAAGVEGWGGLADGKLYRWKLIGTDPGGDVSLIQMERNDGKPFPYTLLGDSDDVRVGDWALAMGNPFVLTEDQKPTVTLGIVSGVKRYQPGAGQNQLVYGNCIQVDSSINPGNSGGPLFNMNAEVIGINGRGSFQDRGRVNVGLGYAISSNQIKNFLPDLLATKLVEHGTLDANFSDRGGKVICHQINQDAPIAEAGLELSDELLEFEGVPIQNANQYTNLICTLPENWPAQLKVRKPDGKIVEFHVRLYGLPYAKPSSRPEDPEEDDPDTQRQIRMQQEMFDLLAAEPGTIRKQNINRKYATQLLGEVEWNKTNPASVVEINDSVWQDDRQIGSCRTILSSDGKFFVEWTEGDETVLFKCDGDQFAEIKKDKAEILTLTESKLTLPIVQALACMVGAEATPFELFGNVVLDGSDKAAACNAYRFKLLDGEDDWFYFWISMFDEDGTPGLRLLKASADIDCRTNVGGVGFETWEAEHGWLIPKSKSFIEGLLESKQMTLKTESVKELADVDLQIFDIEVGGDK